MREEVTEMILRLSVQRTVTQVRMKLIIFSIVAQPAISAYKVTYVKFQPLERLRRSPTMIDTSLGRVSTMLVAALQKTPFQFKNK